MSTAKLSLFVFIVVLFSVSAFAVDGVVLINQASVMAAGGFPYVITQPGSYRLSGNLIVPANTDGIQIKSNGVVLDLNGFQIKGPMTCTGSVGIAITCSPYVDTAGVRSAFSGITVRNGSVMGMGEGIIISGNVLGGPPTGGSSAIVENIYATQNSNFGIEVDGGIVRRCTFEINNSGLSVGSGLVVENYVFLNNNGIFAFSATVINNSALDNGGFGLYLDHTVYGSNTVITYTTFPPPTAIHATSSVSQNNNNCNGSMC